MEQNGGIHVDIHSHNADEETHEPCCDTCIKLGNLETCPIGAGTEQEPSKWDIETMSCSEYVEDESKETSEEEAEEQASGEEE